MTELLAEPRKMGRPKKTNPQKTILSLKGSDEWKEWLARLTEHSRMPTAVLIDVALKEWAARNGFSDPPPKR